MLADGEVHALNEGGIDLPATGRQHLLDRFKRAEHDPVPHPHQAPPAHGFDDLGLQELGQRHPARLGQGACRLPARGLHPLPKVAQQRRGVLLEAIGQKQRDTVGR